MGVCISRPVVEQGNDEPDRSVRELDGCFICHKTSSVKVPVKIVDAQPPALAFAKTVSKSKGLGMNHRRVTSTDVEVYVKNLFETARATGSSSPNTDHHARVSKTTSQLKKTRTIEAVHLDATPFSTAALQEAAFAGQVDAVGRLVRQGYDVHERYVNFETPLHVAAEGGHALMCLELLHHGADVLAVDNDGWTPLHHAALQGHCDCVEALVGWVAAQEGEEGAPSLCDVLNAVDEDGGTPLHAALHVRNYTAVPEHVDHLRRVIAVLIAAGADLNKADFNGWAPLHVAVQTGHVALVEELMASGADDMAEDAEGKLPIDYACNSKGTQFRSREISRILAEAMAKRAPNSRRVSYSYPTTPRGSNPTTPTNLSPPRSPRGAERTSRPTSPMLWDTSEIEHGKSGSIKVIDLNAARKTVAEARKNVEAVEPVDLAAALKKHMMAQEHANSSWKNVAGSPRKKGVSPQASHSNGFPIIDSAMPENDGAVEPPTPTLSANNSIDRSSSDDNTEFDEEQSNAESTKQHAPSDSSTSPERRPLQGKSRPTLDVLMPYRSDDSAPSPRVQRKLNPEAQPQMVRKSAAWKMRHRSAQPYSTFPRTGKPPSGHLAPTSSSIRRGADVINTSLKVRKPRHQANCQTNPRTKGCSVLTSRTWQVLEGPQVQRHSQDRTQPSLRSSQMSSCTTQRMESRLCMTWTAMTTRSSTTRILRSADLPQSTLIHEYNTERTK